MIPLVDRAADAVIGWHAGAPQTTREFLASVARVADALPTGDHIINLVRERYPFSVAFAAIIAAGKTNVLPPNDKPTVQQELAARFDGASVLHDGIDIASGVNAQRIQLDAAATDAHTTHAQIDAAHIAAIAFTSGTTGDAKPIAKTWRMFRGAVEAYAASFLPQDSQIVATVPSQHMYGLELCSLLPLWSPAAIADGKPLYPDDVRARLAALDAPRVLITTPLHLQALVNSGLEFPPLERVLCATAPLTVELAQAVEAHFDAPLIDVYGCSEAGCIATRRLSQNAAWSPIGGFTFTAQSDGTTWVNGDHMDETVPLSDRLEYDASGRFHLAGRFSDLINVAGKRGSLSEISARLSQVPGVTDAAVFAPNDERGSARIAAVFSGTASSADIRQHLRRALDDALIPRPLIRVDAVPRNDTSKVIRDDLLALYQQYRAKR